LLKQSSG